MIASKIPQTFGIGKDIYMLPNHRTPFSFRQRSSADHPRSACRLQLSQFWQKTSLHGVSPSPSWILYACFGHLLGLVGLGDCYCVADVSVLERLLLLTILGSWYSPVVVCAQCQILAAKIRGWTLQTWSQSNCSDLCRRRVLFKGGLTMERLRVSVEV